MFKIGQIAEQRKPFLTNSVIGDDQFPEQQLAAREGITAFAGYPMVVENHLVGVMGMFARQPLAQDTLDAMASVASEVALGVVRKRAEQQVTKLLESERQRSERLRQVAAASLTINSATSPSSVVDVIREEARRIIGARHSEVNLFDGTYNAPAGALIAPLIARSGKPWGHIHLTGKAGGKFSDDDEAILTQLAHMAAVAYDNARLYEELRESDRRKDEFLATLAHELRNPLAPIRNSLQVMRLVGDDRKTLDDCREMIERQLKQMIRLVDDLLDLSRISRGKMQICLEQVELADVIQSALETSAALIEASGHELTINLPSEPILLQGDPTRLAQVLLNLLNNSAKYTEKGGHIWLTAERDGTDVCVTVRDNGIGIPAEMLPRVFEMFTQVDNSLERAQGGLGIGLTLVKRIVEMHRGTIEARSEGRNQGSSFIVRLPLATVPATGHSAPSTNGTGSQVVKSDRRILVVDDNRDSLESLSTLLRMLGNEVRTAPDGLKAVEVAAEFVPEVVLLDLGLPRLNGFDAARRIRELPCGKDMYIIALTGWGQAEDRRRSREAGFNLHLVKPVDPTALEELLAGLGQYATNRI